MDIRLAAMDLDGTLLDGHKRVSEYCARTLRACESRGVHVVLSSGRSYESVSGLAAAIGLHSPVISSNGARADLDGQAVFWDRFPRPLALAAYRAIKETGIPFVCYGPDRVYQMNRDGTDRGLNRGVLWVGARQVPGSRGAALDEAAFLDAGADQALKFVLFCPDPGKLRRAEALLRATTPCQLSASAPDNLEVMVPGGGKGRALKNLMARLGIPQQRVMAFGDSTNDLDMLGAAGYPVAMGNALDQVKGVAWRVAPTCDEEGVAKTLAQFVLEDEG